MFNKVKNILQILRYCPDLLSGRHPRGGLRILRDLINSSIILDAGYSCVADVLVAMEIGKFAGVKLFVF